MIPAFVAKLGLSNQPTNLVAQKIDGYELKTYSMTIAAFSIQDGLGKTRFLEETFMLVDTSMDVVLVIPFLFLSNAYVQLDTRNLTCRTYSTLEALSTTRRVELIDKYEFARADLDKNSKTFVVHVTALEASELAILLSRASPLAVLQQDKVSTKIPSEYANSADVFFLDLMMELAKNTGINKHAIKLFEGKQAFYGLIYSLDPVELETLKAYIKIHLKTGFIRSSKSPAGAPIFFDKKPYGSLRLYVDNQGLNNLIIKNWYPLPLISKSLDRLGCIKWFTQLDLTSAYHQIRIRESDK